MWIQIPTPEALSQNNCTERWIPLSEEEATVEQYCLSQNNCTERWIPLSEEEATVEWYCLWQNNCTERWIPLSEEEAPVEWYCLWHSDRGLNLNNKYLKVLIREIYIRAVEEGEKCQPLNCCPGLLRSTFGLSIKDTQNKVQDHQ